MNDNMRREPTLVLGGTGKTGRRVVERLTARGVPVRIGSRSGEPRFDWEDRSTWQHALAGARAVYLTYYPDLAVPGAVEATRAFAELAVHSGVPRAGAAVGPREPEAERGEQAVRDTAPTDGPAFDLVHAELQRGLLDRARAPAEGPP